MPPRLPWEQDLDVPVPYLPQMSCSFALDGDAHGAHGLQCKKATDLILDSFSSTSGNVAARATCPGETAMPSALICQPHAMHSPTPMGMFQTLTPSPVLVPCPGASAVRCRVKETPSQAKLVLLPPASHGCTGGTRRLTSLHFKLGWPLAGPSILKQQKKYMCLFWLF